MVCVHYLFQVYVHVCMSRRGSHRLLWSASANVRIRPICLFLLYYQDQSCSIHLVRCRPKLLLSRDPFGRTCVLPWLCLPYIDIWNDLTVQWFRLVLVKLIVAQLVRKTSAFLGTQNSFCVHERWPLELISYLPSQAPSIT